MPRFKTTNDVISFHTEFFNENWMNYETLHLPPSTQWDYSRELDVDDVNLWEVIYEKTGGVGVYGAYDPYAEFYLIRYGFPDENHLPPIKTFYGPGSQKLLKIEMDRMKIPYAKYNIWVSDDEAHLFM